VSVWLSVSLSLSLLSRKHLLVCAALRHLPRFLQVLLVGSLLDFDGDLKKKKKGGGREHHR
jgi:hypothetical protein